MNRKLVLLTALAAGTQSFSIRAQVSPAPPQPAGPVAPPTAPPPPQAVPAKIAVISFDQAVIATNEGQRAMMELQKKYEPKQKQFEALNTEIDTLKKQLQAGAATMSQEDQASRVKTIDTKQKQLDRDVEDARTAFQSDQQDLFNKVAQKFAVVMNKYVADNGYTILLNAGAEQSPIMWIASTPNTDISFAVVTAYNTASGIAPPPPDAPGATPSAAPRSTAPRSATPSTTPHTTTPKPQ
jgi:Skp family chaperone for outer membrane proteins